MPLAAYPGVSFFIRAVHVLPVIAVAAAVGGIIGGFTVYAVDSALTWPQPSSQRPDVRADNQSGSQSSAAVEEKTRPVRIVGGAIPDPSAGMSAPPPAQSRQSAPQQSVTQQNPAQLSPQILAAKPLGPPAPLQSPGASQPQAAKASQPQAAKSVQTEKAPAAPPSTAATTQQSTRWPDALSRARQGSSSASSTAQQQTTAPQPNAAPGPLTAKTADEKKAGNERATNVDEDDRASRRGRHGRRLDARAYDRFYNSYGYARGRDETGSRYDTERHYGRYSRYRSRSREIVPDRQDMDQGADRGQSDRGQGARSQASETSRPRSEPFWGGGTRDRFGGSQDDD
jgi:hypothetical protein